VAALEDFTGKRLFTRQHQVMKLTDEGTAFYNAVSPKLEELAEAVEAQVDPGRVLRLHLGVPSLFGGQRLFPRLPELRKQHPRLHIDIDTSPISIRASATRSTPRSSCRRSPTPASMRSSSTTTTSMQSPRASWRPRSATSPTWRSSRARPS
jgi:hypothetical protein